jgi:hypothetical protein
MRFEHLTNRLDCRLNYYFRLSERDAAVRSQRWFKTQSSGIRNINNRSSLYRTRQTLGSLDWITSGKPRMGTIGSRLETRAQIPYFSIFDIETFSVSLVWSLETDTSFHLRCFDSQPRAKPRAAPEIPRRFDPGESYPPGIYIPFSTTHSMVA